MRPVGVVIGTMSEVLPQSLGREGRYRVLHRKGQDKLPIAWDGLFCWHPWSRFDFVWAYSREADPVAVAANLRALQGCRIGIWVVHRLPANDSPRPVQAEGPQPGGRAAYQLCQPAQGARRG